MDGFQLVINSEGMAGKDIGRFIGLKMIPGIVALVATAIGVMITRKIILPMKKGESPFTGGIHKNLSLLSWVVLAGYLLTEIANFICTKLLVHDITCWNLFNEKIISGISASPVNIRFEIILIVAILFLLSYVFKYGEKLQQESDETL